MRREFMEEMMAFACRSLSHSRRHGDVERLNDSAEGRVIETENEDLKDTQDGG